MNARRSATTYYSRKTLALWVGAVAAILMGVFGYLLVREKSQRKRETATLREQLRNSNEEIVKLKVAHQILKIQAEKMTQKKPPATEGEKPSLPQEMISRFFPVGQAIAVIPNRLYVTLARLDGERARIRVAAVEEDDKNNRSRTLSPGQTWRFTAEKISYALIFHSTKSSPPGALLSIRRVNP